MKTLVFCSIGNKGNFKNFSIFTFLYHKLAKLRRLTRPSRNKYARTFKKGLGRSLIDSTVSLNLRLNILYPTDHVWRCFFYMKARGVQEQLLLVLSWEYCSNYSLQRAANLHSMCIQSGRTISILPLHKLSDHLFKVPMK